MEAQELRQFSVEELKARVLQWQEELFRARFKTESTENRDTSIFRKLKRDIARAKTVISEHSHGIKMEAKPQDKPVAAKADGVEAPAKAPKKTAKKKAESKGAKNA